MSDPAQFNYDAESVAFVERMLRDANEQRDGKQSNGAAQLGPTFSRRTIFDPARPSDSASVGFQRQVDSLVEAYRNAGHRAAAIDPLGLLAPDDSALQLDRFGLSNGDLGRRVSRGQTLRELIENLRATYCGTIAYQFSHVYEPHIRDWLLRRIEHEEAVQRSEQDRTHVLKLLTEAELFDSYLRKKHPGAKTFSLEGAESLIVLLDAAIEQSAATGIDEIVMAMAHRGRLNVLANIIDKPASAIFREFADEHPEEYLGGGDVKYHLGASCDRRAANGSTIHLSLCFNPSHLEVVAPIALGRMRAKQARAGDEHHERGLVLVIHGDAAFAGEGVVQETLNLSQLPDYEVGGALHVILNNQIGFTTIPNDGRSMPYASDVACMLQSPILRVNGDDVDAVLRAVTFALDFRREFHRDVFIDLICYRRWGHNEIDEPSFTQPLMYRAIEQLMPVRESFAKQLVGEGLLSTEQVEDIADSVNGELREQYKLAESDGKDASGPPPLKNIWIDYLGGPEPDDDAPDTGIDRDQLRQLLEQTTELPNNFHLHKKLHRAFEQRQQMARGEEPLDWAAAEALAFASLAVEGYGVRLSGQDSARGTFSQRHAVLHDAIDGHTHSIFGDNVQVINSPLCETAAMAFEYGYSLDHPESLVLWEAQFGDFVNAAQVVIDQFLSSAEDKWNRLSGLVLLLPHGFEGQGPEHSSARLERLLMLVAEDNVQVVQPTTPAQYFHCLRRQVLRRWRKPLVVLTPKSLLRHAAVRSPIADFAEGSFRRVLLDETKSPRRLLLCSGKLYYELAATRQKRERDDIAIVRVEQFYPLADAEFEAACKHCDDDTEVFWVQDEPENMGAWPYWKRRFGDRLLNRFAWNCISRPESASPATGSHASHAIEEQRLIERAFGEEANDEPQQRRTTTRGERTA